MKYILTIFIFLLVGCNFEATEESSDSLIAGHKSIEDKFSIQLPSDGIYGVAQNLDFKISHPAQVTVVGVPQIQIEVGENTRFANYISGSGTKTLTFRYTLQAGETDSDSIDISPTILLAGGSLKYQSGGSSLDATTTISNFPDYEILVITNDPQITFNLPPSPRTYRDGESLIFAVKYERAVTVSGVPSVSIDIGGSAREATYLSGSGGSNLIFRYVVQLGDSDGDGIGVSGVLTLNGGAIKDLANNSADLTFIPRNTSFVFVEGAAPYVSSLNLPINRTYLSGDIINFALVFNESVTVSGGTPSVSLGIGSNSRVATYFSGSGSNTLHFQYVVNSNDLDDNGLTIGNLITLNGATIENVGSVNSINTFTSPLTPGVLVYGATPSIVSITPPADGDYLNGNNLDFIVEFSEDVIVSSFPRLALDIGGVTFYANFIGGSGTKNLTFRYSTGLEEDTDGIAFDSTLIDLNGGTIVSEITSKNASLGFSGVAPTLAGVIINGTPVTQLVYIIQPVDTAVNTSITPDIVIELRDASNSLVTSASNSVTIAIDTDPIGGSVLSGTLTVNAVAGVATFSGISIDQIGANFTLVANSTGLPSVISNNFDITALPPADLRFSVSPTNTLAGDAITASIQVEIVDTNGDVVTTATDNVTLSFGTDASSGSATLGGTLSQSAVAGIATFNDISIDKAFDNYTLTANATGLTSDTSASFNISPNVASQLAFSTEPSDTEILTSISPALEVEVQDAFGNKTSGTNSIVLAIGNDAAGSSTLSGTTTVSAVDGVATFSDINLDQPGVGFTLNASTIGLTSGVSAAFNITTTPVALRVLSEPSNTNSGESIAPAVTVEVIDAAGNVVVDNTDVIVVTFGNDASAGAGTLSGTLSVNAVAGVATFSGLSIDSIAVGYTLNFTSGVLTAVTSSAFDINAAVATKLSFTVEPSNTVAGESISPSIVVELLDAGDSLVTGATNSVTLTINTDPSNGAATIGGTFTKAAVGGVVTFDDISIDKVGFGYTLDASAAGLTSDTSASFDISVAAAAQLVFKTEPTDAEVLEDISPAIEIEIQDAFGNLTTNTDSITIATSNDPSGSSTLVGTKTVSAIAGIASFSDLNLNKPGVGYTLFVSAAGLGVETSASFNITSTPSKLRMLVMPTDTESLASINPRVKVEVLDAADNVVTTATNSVSVAFGTDASVGAATLSGTLSVNAVAGIATFSDLSVDTIASGYTLDFSSVSLINIESDAFDITQPPATELSFGVEPSNTVAGVNISSSLEVEIVDTNGNIVPDATDAITLAFQSDPSGGNSTLSGTLTVNAVAGVATFNDININKAFTGYTLIATSPGLTSKISTPFNITHAAATKLAYLVAPSDENEGASIAPGIQISILDAFDNIVTSATNSIAIAFGTDASSGNATLSGVLSKSAVAGVATFSDISIDFASSGYTLTATSAGITSVESSPFDIFGVPTKLSFSTQPSDTEIGNNLSNVIVRVLDGSDSLVGNATNTITLSLAADPSGGSASFSGTLSRPAVNGVATFTGLNLDEAGANYIIKATSSGLTFVNSSPFNITLSAPTFLTLITPTSSPSDDTTPTIRVGTVDSGNLVKLYSDSGCSTEIASFTSTSSTVDLTTNTLAEGVYTIYAKRFTSSGSPSACSTASLGYEVQGSFYQLDSFANNDFGNWSNVGGDQRDWSTNSGGTTSTDVGPTAASSGTHYIYTEASSPVAANDEFYLESNILDGSADDLAFSFDWNKRGNDMGNLILEASNNGGGTWSEVWRHDGADIANGGLSTWRSGSVDLCGAGFTSNNVKLRFRGVMPAAGTIYFSDMALDELEVNSGGCTPGVPANLAISVPTTSTAVGVLNESSFEISGTCSDNGENVTLSGDVSGSTTCSSGIWSFFLDLSAYPDGSINISADHTSSSGGANGVDSVTVVKDSLSIQFDDMTNFGNWANVGTDDRDWSINTGGTASNNVGPTAAQGGSGSYIYTEASNPVAAGDEFIIESNSVDAGLFNVKFEFFWNKRGDNMGDLHLEVSTDGGITWDAPVWEDLGVDVATGGADVWRPQSVDLCNAGYNTGNIKLRFRAVMPSAGNIWNSDIAIDSLKFTNDGCP